MKPAIAVLGLAERAAHVFDGNTDLLKWNVIGLKHVVLAHIYPFSLNGWFLALAVRKADPASAARLSIVDETGVEVGWIELSYVRYDDPTKVVPLKSDGPRLIVPRDGWMPAFLPLSADNPITIPRPGVYRVLAGQDAPENVIGEPTFILVDPPALTAERIAAIRSDPHATRAVRLALGCPSCPSKLWVYAALERIQGLENKEHVWYQDLADEWRCGCGRSLQDLRIIRRNLFGLVGQPVPAQSKDISYVPLYERSALDTVLRDFNTLLDQAPSEETLQRFIQENPVLLQQFPAQELFLKPPILTFFNADFAIVTPQKELVLIEIERVNTRLLKKDGGEAAELQHAFDQVRSWLHIVDEHRLAVLESLNVEREAVSSVRGVVIAGRDRGHDPEHLRRLKGVDRGRISLLTYDDLASGLAALMRRMSRL